MRTLSRSRQACPGLHDDLLAEETRADPEAASSVYQRCAALTGMAACTLADGDADTTILLLGHATIGSDGDRTETALGWRHGFLLGCAHRRAGRLRVSLTTVCQQTFLHSCLHSGSLVCAQHSCIVLADKTEFETNKFDCPRHRKFGDVVPSVKSPQQLMQLQTYFLPAPLQRSEACLLQSALVALEGAAAAVRRAGGRAADREVGEIYLQLAEVHRETGTHQWTERRFAHDDLQVAAEWGDTPTKVIPCTAVCTSFCLLVPQICEFTCFLHYPLPALQAYLVLCRPRLEAVLAGVFQDRPASLIACLSTIFPNQLSSKVCTMQSLKHELQVVCTAGMQVLLP